MKDEVHKIVITEKQWDEAMEILCHFDWEGSDRDETLREILLAMGISVVGRIQLHR